MCIANRCYFAAKEEENQDNNDPFWWTRSGWEYPIHQIPRVVAAILIRNYEQQTDLNTVQAILKKLNKCGVNWYDVAW